MMPDERRVCSGQARAVGWALHALEPDEDIAVQYHAPRCLSCRTAIRDAELVMVELAMSVPQIDPPARLRRAVLARAATTAQVGRMIPRPRPRPADDRGARDMYRSVDMYRPVEIDEPSGVVDDRLSSPRFSRGRRLLVAAAAAVTLAVGGLATYTAQVRAERDMEVTQSRALADVVIELGRPGTAHATLTGSGGVPVAAVLLADGKRTVVTTGLAPNDQEHTVYVVWGFTDKGPRPIGTFDVTASHVDVYSTSSTSDPTPFAGYAISLESGRVAPVSPTTVVASGPVET